MVSFCEGELVMSNLFKLVLIKNDQSAQYDITPVIGSLSWDNDFTLTTALEFDVAVSDARFPTPESIMALGDMVVLTKGSDEIFRGVIVNESRKGRSPRSYVAYDFSWLLNQSKIVIQFNNISATQAITQVLEKFGLEIGSIPSMPTLIDKVYIQETPGKIIQDIIDLVEKREGYTLNGEMREGKIYLEKRKDLVIKGSFQLAENIAPEDVTAAVSEPNRTLSIEEMRNSIKIMVEEEETQYEITAEAKDDELIGQYGLLEEVIKIDAEDAAKSRQAAKIILARLGRVHETINLKLPGDIRFRAGYLFDIREPVTGINGRFIIVSAKHKVERQVHTMDLELSLPGDVV